MEQSDFPPDYRSVKDMLRVKIARCDAVIQVVGFQYGSEPSPETLPQGGRRRSYTQLEADVARSLDKPLYSFVCTEGFPFDPGQRAAAEDKRELQQAYRDEILSGRKELRYEISGNEELERYVAQLQTRIEKIETKGRRFRRTTLVAAAASVVVLVIVARVTWQSLDRTESTLQASQKEFSRLAGKLDSQEIEVLRAAWAAESPTLSDLPARWGDLDHATLNPAATITEDWKQVILQTEEALARLRGAVEGARPSLPERLFAVMGALGNGLAALSQETQGLAALRSEWASWQKGRGLARAAELIGGSDVGWIDWYQGRLDRFKVMPGELLAKHTDSVRELESLLEDVFSSRTPDRKAAEVARRERLDSEELAQQLARLRASAMVSGDLAAELDLVIADAERAAVRQDWTSSIPILGQTLTSARERLRERAVKQSLLIGPEYVFFVWSVENREAHRWKVLMGRVSMRARALGLDFDPRVVRWQARQLPDAAGSILDGDLRHSVERHWGSECRAALYVGYKMLYVVEGLRPAGAVRFRSRWDSKGQLLHGLNSFVADLEEAQLPGSILEMAATLVRTVESFDFEADYRRPGSRSHDELF